MTALMTELSPGQVTVADLYKEIVNVRREVGDVAIGVRLAEDRRAGDLEVRGDHERRIRALERAWWKVAGAAGVLAAAVSLVTALLTLHWR